MRGVHGGTSDQSLACRVAIQPAPGRLGRALARLAGLPWRASVLEGELRIRRGARGEVWERRFGRDRITTRQWEEDGRLVEAFGLLQLVFALRAAGGALHFDQLAARLGWGRLRVPLPVSVAPVVRARVWADGAPHAAVAVSAPGVGLLCAYEGVMMVAPPA